MEIPLAGTSTLVSFFPDDTIDTVRQYVALAMNSHPDRLFVQVKTELPADYYEQNPKNWMDLFYRLSLDGHTVMKEMLEIYTNQIRLGTNVVAKEFDREEWESYDSELEGLFRSAGPFHEWRIFGVPSDKSFVLPTPPRDLRLDAKLRPVPVRQGLFESLHRYEIKEFKATEIDDDASDSVKQVYFPFFTSTTPSNIETLRGSLLGERDQLKKLLSLKAPEPSGVSVLRAKWYIPLISSQFTAPRVRFEQIFYGMSVSKTTPVISYFTSKSEITRHKFFVEDPKTKTPLLDIPTWKAWTSNTQPQRKMPTLLLYRGSSRSSFERIAITPKSITISTYRGKTSTETIESLQERTMKWLLSLDALVPFLVQTDIHESRWELNDLALLASYPKEIKEFDMRRFPCMQSIFDFKDDTFRLLRADRETDVSARLLQAYRILRDGDASTLVSELGVSESEARELVEKVQDLEANEGFNFDKAISGYPVITFSAKEVMIKFVSNMDRVLTYANVLRYVLSSPDRADVEAVCPARMEEVQTKAGIAPIKLEIDTEFDLGDFKLEGFEEEKTEPVHVPEPTVERKRLAIQSSKKGTHNYFNNLARAFDDDMFDSEYAKKCEKLKQVVVLDTATQDSIPDEYNYKDADPKKKLQLDGAIAICPQYWCMKDEIPLSAEQLVSKEDGLHCPSCDGKVRITDKEPTNEYTVIKRVQDHVYPDWKVPTEKAQGKKRVPCCYKKPAATTEVIKQATDEFYVLSSGFVPGLRLAFLPEDLTSRLGIKTDYKNTVPTQRFTGALPDMFRIGMGLPRTTLPIVLKDQRPIPQPASEAGKEKIKQCSFFRTWKDTADTDGAPGDRIIASIDKAYTEKKLGVLEETEYVALVLDCRVLRIRTSTNTMLCGFWSEKFSSKSRSIVLLDQDILGNVKRRTGHAGPKFDYVVDVAKFPPAVQSTLQELNTKACVSDTPTLQDAINELRATGKSEYQIILDPFGRVQAVFVPHEVVLPIQPTPNPGFEGIRVRNGYSEIEEEELPTTETLGSFLENTKHDGFKRVEDLYSADGTLSEYLLASGFRAPFRTEEGQGPAKEVVKTIREHTEEMLVDGEGNEEDAAMEREISYSSEVFEFLMFSLSKDIQTDEYEGLRTTIASGGDTLYKELHRWLKEQAYWSSVEEPVRFVNKIRAPCGQLTQDSCSSSTLCGWKSGTCKIKVNPIVDRTQILKRLTKTLKLNVKQRALVLDGRLSPFFSSILYLEMPHELITTNP
jgi:hypothetical protein